MDFLKDHEAVKQIVCLMRENGKTGEAEEFLWLLECVDNMEQQYSAVLSELQEIREQLEQVQVPEQASMKVQALDALQAAQEKLKQARNQLAAVKDKLISWTKNALEDVKRLGITALDTAISALGVQTMLEFIADKKLYQSPQHKPLRPKLPLTALKNLEIHKGFLRFFALPPAILSRKSVYFGYWYSF